MDLEFSNWIDVLRENVIQDGYGYEEGEFTVYPDLWRPLYDQGLTPIQAFKKALDAFAQEREESEAQQKENWRRICQEEGRTVTDSQSAAIELADRRSVVEGRE